MYENPNQVVTALADLEKRYELDRKTIQSKCPHRVVFRDPPTGNYTYYKCDACGCRANLLSTVVDLDTILKALK